MNICDETISFISFVGIGFLFSIIFDFFRALRKLKRVKNGVVYLQDIVYFVTIGIILLIFILNIRMDAFRLYLILAIILGVIIYISILGNTIMNFLVNIFKMSNMIVEFIFLPFKLYITLFDKQIRKIKKYVVGCCKKISYMIKFYHKKMFYSSKTVLQKKEE